MITISLDEKGVFENNLNSTGSIIMIAGIVYDDKDDDKDADRERSRIKHYFEDICLAESAAYPQALHWGSAPDYKVRKVKDNYMRSLGEFLKEGKCHGKPVASDDGMPRGGEYYVYALVKSRKGKPELIKAEISNLINENNASNLYMHMVEDTISRLLFHNRIFSQKKEVTLDLATRVYVTPAGNDVSALTDIGYRSRVATRNGQTNTIVSLTNQDVFRTALERDMLSEESDNELHIKSLMVRSIDYHNANAGHEFLYMADAVCTYLGEDNNYGTNKNYLEKVWDRMDKLTGEQRMLFSYDIVDTYFVKAWRSVSAGDIYSALSFFYDAVHENSEAAGFYKTNWETVLYERIAEKIQAGGLAETIRKITGYSRSNNINQEKLVYLFEGLEEIIQKSDLDDSQTKSVLYDFYDVGVTAYNHVGKTEKAAECIEKCKQYKTFIGIDRVLRNRNREAVGICDSFRYEEAEKLILPSYQYYQTTYETEKRLFGDESKCNSTEYAIVCSQLGQIYSYMCDERAEEMFQKALSMMEKGSADYYITMSYFLHYYLQTKEKEKYEKYAKEYFGGNDDLEQQLIYIIKEGSKEHNAKVALKFALFVYVKAVNAFYVDSLAQSLVLKLADIKKTIEQIDENGLEHFNGHPWEISYKYLAMIAVKNKQFTAAANYQKAIVKFDDEKGLIIDLILLLSEIEVSKLRSPEVNLDSKMEEACKLIKQINPNIEGLDNSLEAIYKVVTYTYQ